MTTAGPSDADWFVGAVCRLLACFCLPPFFGGIGNEFFVRSSSFFARSPTDELSRGSPLQFSFKYSQSHPDRSGGSLQGRASSVSLAWSETLQHSRQTLSDALTATRKDRQAHILRVQDSFQQGLAAVSEATVLLPLMRLPAHFPPFDDSARQSVGIDGDDDT